MLAHEFADITATFHLSAPPQQQEEPEPEQQQEEPEPEQQQEEPEPEQQQEEPEAEMQLGESNNSSSTELSLCPRKSEFTSIGQFENAMGLFFGSPKIKQIEENIQVLENKWLRESILVLTQAKKSGKTVYGYVYALSNPLFPDMLKIGATFRTPEIRARELSGTGTPEPFVVVAELKCRDPFGIEREVHQHFSDVRTYGRKKEFFSLSVDTVSAYFQTLKENAMRDPSISRAEHINKRLKRMKKWQRGAQNPTSQDSGSAKEQKAQENTPSTPQASAPDFTPSYSSGESTARAVPVVQGEYVSAINFEEIILKLMSSVNDVDFSLLKEKITFLLDTKQRVIEQRKSILDLEFKEFQLSVLKKNSKKRALDQEAY
jgi:hypothetical protein